MNINDYIDKRFQNLPLEVVPQSFCRIDFSKRIQFLSFLQYPKRKPFPATEKTKGEGGESDHDADAAATETEKSKHRNPDSGRTVIIRITDPVPTSHPLGAFPPRWKNYQPNYRGLVLIHHMRRVFAQIPGKFPFHISNSRLCIYYM